VPVLLVSEASCRSLTCRILREGFCVNALEKTCTIALVITTATLHAQSTGVVVFPNSSHGYAHTTHALPHTARPQGNEAFFSSPRLAQLSTRAEVIAQQAAQQAEQASGKDSKTDASQLLSSWECPICLEALHQPVVLTYVCCPLPPPL